ncbi:glycosyltransferase [Microbacterium sp. GXS0129]|uniref:glycosyltransferase n=1 Tax=Microbacterium sp. GXS0129 TaxID=3377836 RepID=UPI00383BF5D7
MKPIQLVSIADSDNDAYTLLHGERDDPLNGRHGVAAAVRDILLGSTAIDAWWILTADGWYDAASGLRVAQDIDQLRDYSGVLFDPLRHYRDRLAMFRAQHQLPWPIVTMAHSVGYGPWVARGQADLLWDPHPQDVVLFPSEAARAAWKELNEHLQQLSGRPTSLPQTEILPYHVTKVRSEHRASPAATEGSGHMLLTIGRLDPIEKFDFVAYARACHEVGKADDIYVMIAGRERSPDSTAWIEEIFRELAPDVRITVRPNITDREKWDLLWEAAALIHPTNSHAESFGIVLDEASATGLPIVASNFSGQPEALQGYANARLATGSWPSPPATNADTLLQFGRMSGGRIDPTSLAEGIRWALTAGRTTAGAHDSDSNFADQLLETLAKAAPVCSRTNLRGITSPLSAFSDYWQESRSQASRDRAAR